jgi:hypothetical protein
MLQQSNLRYESEERPNGSIQDKIVCYCYADEMASLLLFAA